MQEILSLSVAIGSLVYIGLNVLRASIPIDRQVKSWALPVGGILVSILIAVIYTLATKPVVTLQDIMVSLLAGILAYAGALAANETASKARHNEKWRRIDGETE
jgi:4-hydroxybenzoate polyprenyltransferase